MAKVITIDVIADPIITRINNSKGGYDALEIAFKDDGKVAGKKMNNFYQKDIFNQVKEFKRGDRIKVELEKEASSDGREFWQWKQVSKLATGEVVTGTPDSRDVSSSQTSSRPAAEAPTRSTGKVTGSNYETPEERALKQVLIVRQSSVEQANKYLASQQESNQGTYGLTTLLETAGEIYEWVFDQGRLTPPALTVEEAIQKINQKAEEVKDVKPRGRGKATAPVKGPEPSDFDDDLPF